MRERWYRNCARHRCANLRYLNLRFRILFAKMDAASVTAPSIEGRFNQSTQCRPESKPAEPPVPFEKDPATRSTGAARTVQPTSVMAMGATSMPSVSHRADEKQKAVQFFFQIK